MGRSGGGEERDENERGRGREGLEGEGVEHGKARDGNASGRKPKMTSMFVFGCDGRRVYWHAPGCCRFLKTFPQIRRTACDQEAAGIYVISRRNVKKNKQQTYEEKKCYKTIK